MAQPLRRSVHTTTAQAAADRIIVHRLPLRARLRGDAWQRDVVSLQPLTLTLTAHVDVTPAALTDELQHTLNYVALAEDAQLLVESPAQTWDSVHHVADEVARAALQREEAPAAVTVEVEQPSGALRAEALVAKVSRRPKESALLLDRDVYSVKNLQLDCIIGELEMERPTKQRIRVNIDACPSNGSVDLLKLVEVVQTHILAIEPRLIETMCHSVSLAIFAHFDNIEEVKVRIGKPSALSFPDSMDVQVSRKRDQLASYRLRDAPGRKATREHVAVIAIGSNLGDRADFLWRALNLLRADPATELLETSYLYESEPMYMVDQPTFFNGVCAISTDRSPTQLLDLLKAIEDHLGRVKVVDKGPRCIDLDLLLYDDLVVDEQTRHGALQVPHIGIVEREFVLRPLADLIPAYYHPVLLRPISHLLDTTMATQGGRSQLHRIFPLKGGKQHILHEGPTQIMSIINVTPDSFSDGGDAFKVADALASAKLHIEQGADLLDIGGASTRPGAIDPGEEEEARRVVPVVQAIRAEGIATPISVDTYRAEVARQAVEGGANVINDVSCGAFPESAGLLEMAAQLRCPIILMHTRGTSQTMGKLTDYGSQGVMAGVRVELAARVQEAMRAGLPRWAIMVDPGIGFAKDLKGNTELLRELADFNTQELAGFPVLLGSSRKRFLGTITGHEDAKTRNWATAATISAGIAAGVQVVRVHDTKEMKDVALVADAIWRKKRS